MCDALAHGHQLVRQPLALGPHQQCHRRLRNDTPQRLAGPREERNPLAREIGHRLGMGYRHGEDRAHARPHGLRRVRIGTARPERYAGRAEGLRRAQDRADVAGIVDFMEIHAQWADGRRRPTAGSQRCS